MKEQELALRIREQRIKKGMTQKQLAETLHISDKAISKCTKGAQSGRMANAYLIDQ